MILKQSTAYSRKFLMVLTSDHLSGATGKTVTVELSKGAGAAGTTAAGTVTELDSTNLPGMYQVALTTADTATVGDLGFECTASGCDHTTFIDQVQATIFTDLVLDGSGNVSITSSFKKNSTIAFFPFPMTVNGVPTPGLSVTATRNLGSGFSACVNAVTEISNGTYTINLPPADTNANTGIFRFTAVGADDRDILFFFQP